MNEWVARRHVKVLAQKMGFSEPVLWLNPHSAGHMAGRMGESAVIYDITDDWISLNQGPSLRRLIQEQDAELCRKADAVIVCSQRLLEMKQTMTRSLHLIPNGVDADHYAGVRNGRGALPEAAAKWKKPIFGYTGSVHPERVDVELVRELARRVEGTVVLLGPDMLPPADKAKLNLPNIVVHGPVPYCDVPDYMAAFDVCIVPHKMTPFTESLNPIKLWEYLAAGKPIVSTDVAGFRDYPQFVGVVRTADEFAAAAVKALSEDPALADARQAEARHHTWHKRVDEIEEVIALAVQSARGPLKRTI